MNNDENNSMNNAEFPSEEPSVDNTEPVAEQETINSEDINVAEDSVDAKEIDTADNFVDSENADVTDSSADSENADVTYSSADSENTDVTDSSVEADKDNETSNITDYDSNQPEAAKSSKKGTYTLIIVIMALVVVAAVLIVLFVTKNNKDEADNNTQPTAVATQAPDTSNTADNTVTPATDSTDSATTPEPTKIPVVTVELGQYKGIEVTKEVAEVTEAQIQYELDMLAQKYTELVQVEGRTDVQSGDIIIFDYEGKIDGVPFDRGAATDAELEIGSNSFIPGFEDALIGKLINEPTVIDVTFPDPYQNNPDMSGVAATFDITVKSINYRHTPELTDELIKEKEGYDSLEAYKTHIHDTLAAQNEQNAEATAINKVFETAVTSAVFGGDIAEACQAMSDELLYNYETMAMQYGMDIATMAMYYGMDEATFYGYIDAAAANQVKLINLLKEVIKVEELTITEEEYNTSLQAFMAENGVASEEEFYQYVTREQFEEDVLMDKAYNLIIDTAIIK